MSFKAVVFDFDGTMCLLFKNYDLTNTIKELHIAMKNIGIDFCIENDSFDVFETIMQQTEDGERRTQALLEANEILTNAELKAIDSCELVSGLIDTIRFLFDKGILIGIASNNSSRCIKKLLNRLWPDIPIPITGRIGDKPFLMKPNSWTLTETLLQMNCNEEDTIFVGDTKRDYLCSEKTKCRFIGMASTKRKEERLLQFLPHSQIVSDFYNLQEYLMRTL